MLLWSKGIFPFANGKIFQDTDSRKFENGTSCRKGQCRTNTNTTAVEREKADTAISENRTGVKVSVTYPENVPDTIRQEKINRIYDILAKHTSE